MAEPAENGENRKVRSFQPRPWSAELVERFEKQDRRFDQQDKRFEQADKDIAQLKNDYNLQTMALQGIQREFGEHKKVTDRAAAGVDRILALLGEEVEDGDGGWKATGLLGRTRRNEGAVTKLNKLYNRWLAWGAGFYAAALAIGGFFLTVVWYLMTHNLPKLTP